MIKNGENRGIIVVNDDECMMIFRTNLLSRSDKKTLISED